MRLKYFSEGEKFQKNRIILKLFIMLQLKCISK